MDNVKNDTYQKMQRNFLMNINCLIGMCLGMH